MKTLYRDVIVVGSGPAGSTCAAFLLRQGISPLLVDKEIFPRNKPCGDGQAGVTTLMLEELGWLDGLREIGFENKGIIATGPDYTKVVVEAPLKGYRYNTSRRIFDDYCRRQAMKEGAEMLEDFWVYDLIIEDGIIKGVKAKYQGEFIEVRSKVVIGADGSHSIIAKKIGMFVEKDTDVAVVGRCYYEDVDIEPYNYIHFDENVLPGYVWVFPLRDNVVNVGLGFNRNFYVRSERKPLEEYLDIWIESSPYGAALKGKRRVGEFGGWRISFGSFGSEGSIPNYAPGCLLIGDAGSMVMPLTGEGIGPAMVTAKMVAGLCREALDKNDFVDVFKKYPDLRDAKYAQKYATIKTLEGAIANKDTINGLIHGMHDDEDMLNMFKQQWFFELYESMDK